MVQQHIPDTSGVAEGVWCLTKPAMFLYFLLHQSFAELVHNAKNFKPQTHWEFLSCQVRPSKHPNTATLLRKAHCTLVAAWPCKPFVTCVQVKFKCNIHQIDILEGPVPFSIIHYASICRSWPHLLTGLAKTKNSQPSKTSEQGTCAAATAGKAKSIAMSVTMQWPRTGLEQTTPSPAKVTCNTFHPLALSESRNKKPSCCKVHWNTRLWSNGMRFVGLQEGFHQPQSASKRVQPTAYITQKLTLVLVPVNRGSAGLQ